MVSRLIGGAVGTVLVGVLAGFVASSIVGIVVQDSGVMGGNGESPIARSYMLGLLQQDPALLTNVRPAQDITSRAKELQGTQTRNTAITPLSLTYLGGGSAGPVSVHIYAVGLRNPSGVDQFFPLALTVLNGKVIRSE
jgi:hypothetical protein